MLKDTQAEREQMVKDMANRCKGIIEEAMKWAPETMRSHLKEYINNKVKIVFRSSRRILYCCFGCARQCFGSGSALDLHSMGSWIRIRIANTDPDPEERKSPKKDEKLFREKEKKIIKITVVFSVQTYLRQRTWPKNV
jgi:hypothetical protein